ncbi:MAG: endolytic transglycosylase MltG, partial [Patescibacteria group bacterium]
PLTREDLEINSPYNTYKFTGLPPTPIANPGLSSIKAALYPEESAYWFYLHDAKGNIHFAKTIEEHHKNVREFLGK